MRTGTKLCLNETDNRPDAEQFAMQIMKVSRRFVALMVVGLLVSSSGCASASLASHARPAEWATPVTTQAGLPNLYRVNENLYRAAQPSREGFIFLSTQTSLSHSDRPIKTVVSLRSSNEDIVLEPENSGLKLEHIRFNTWRAEDKDVIHFLRIVSTPAMQPVLVHCKHGSDRTGMMIAIYRVAHEGWSKQQAIDEMLHGGYGFHPLWQNLVRYINALDINAIKQEAARQGPLH
jgi:protein tyrosine phosphatase (PTP) superfamily phosphohydrolase (DUF442 family)